MSNDKIVVERPGKKIYRDGDKLVKLFDKGYSKADILNEALNQARVEETDLNIPKITEVSVVDGCWSITMDYIDGTTLEQLMNEHPEKIDEYLDIFVDIQKNVQSKRVPLLNMLIEKMHRKISAADIDATTRYDLHTRLNGMKRHLKLCHGDFNPSNIIITADGTPYIPRAMPPQTQRALIFCSTCKAKTRLATSTSNCSARRRIPPFSTCRSGYPLLRLPAL